MGRFSLHVHERQLSCLYRLRFPYLLAYCSSERAGYFISLPHWLLCEYLELKLCDLHIEFRLCLTALLSIRNTTYWTSETLFLLLELEIYLDWN